MRRLLSYSFKESLKDSPTHAQVLRRRFQRFCRSVCGQTAVCSSCRDSFYFLQEECQYMVCGCFQRLPLSSLQHQILLPAGQSPYPDTRNAAPEHSLLVMLYPRQLGSFWRHEPQIVVGVHFGQLTLEARATVPCCAAFCSRQLDL